MLLAYSHPLASIDRKEKKRKKRKKLKSDHRVCKQNQNQIISISNFRIGFSFKLFFVCRFQLREVLGNVVIQSNLFIISIFPFEVPFVVAVIERANQKVCACTLVLFDFLCQPRKIDFHPLLIKYFFIAFSLFLFFLLCKYLIFRLRGFQCLFPALVL